MKVQFLAHLENEVMAGRFQMSEGQDLTITAWTSGDTPKRTEAIRLMVEQAEDFIEKLKEKPRLRPRHHLARLGRMFFRLGDRTMARKCGKVIGISTMNHGWQHQCLSTEAHDRIRSHFLGGDIAADTWQRDPALACSAMTIPLWLKDGVNRLPELMGIFANVDECPWVFPRLQHIFQWHVALSGNQKALEEIESLAPDDSIGLAIRSGTH